MFVYQGLSNDQTLVSPPPALAHIAKPSQAVDHQGQWPFLRGDGLFRSWPDLVVGITLPGMDSFNCRYRVEDKIDSVLTELIVIPRAHQDSILSESDLTITSRPCLESIQRNDNVGLRRCRGRTDRKRQRHDGSTHS